MSGPNPDPSVREKRVNDVIAAYLEAADAGEPPDSNEFLARHSDIAAELEAFFADRDKFQRMARPLKDLDGQQPKPDHEATLPSQTGSGAAADQGPTRIRYFGDYELLEKIAHGGMGVVYKARQTTLKRIVALKMILTGQLASDQDVKRFYAEAEAAAKLQHPNIVPIFEIGQHEGQHYFSMAYVDGENLAHKVSAGPLPPRQAARIMKQVAEAVAYAHVEGVVHRDLKPANILLQAGDTGESVPKVTDFGLAKRLPVRAPDEMTQASQTAASQLTATGQILGTPSYMPPEQAAGRAREIGPLTDVYSLGAVLYCLVTGRPPFQAQTPLDTLMQVIEDDPVSPRRLNSRVPQDLETICLKCLRKEPRHRYRSAAELADDLGRFLAREPIRARPVSPPERLWYWLRRQQRSVVLTAAAVAATVLVLVLGVVGRDVYRQSQLGHVALESVSAGLVADVFDRDGNVVVRDASVPSRHTLPAGAYDLRVSRRGALSTTLQFDVDPAFEQKISVQLPERTLWPEPIRLIAPDRFEVIELDGTPDVILLPHDAAAPTLARIDGRSGQEIWKVDWSAEGEWAQTALSEQGRHAWSTLLACWNDTAPTSPPELLKPAPDINGDGVGDLIWATRHTPSILAVSGADGTLWWWFRPEPPVENPGGGFVQGLPVVTDFDDDATPDLIAAFSSLVESAGGAWVEAVSGATGASLARSALAAPARMLRLADLDGDHRPEILLLQSDETSESYQVVALSAGDLSHLRPALSVPIPADRGPDLPLLADLNDDGSLEAIVPTGGGQLTRLDRWLGVAAHDVGSGEELWAEHLFAQTRGNPPSPLPYPHVDRAAVGPDLDADGYRDLFLATGLSRRVFVHAMSGKTGRNFWWSEIELGEHDPKQIEPLRWWGTGADGWPQLVITVGVGELQHGAPGAQPPQSFSSYVFSASSGRMVRSAEGLRVAEVADFTGEGIADLCALVPDTVPGPGESPGALQVLRDEPPAIWTRAEAAWEAAEDLDGDGLAELTARARNRNMLRVISGETGRELMLLNAEWNSGAYFLPQAHTARTNSDLDGDAVPDIVVSNTWMAMNDRWTPTLLRVPVPLKAFSGRTGRLLWTARDFPKKSDGNLAGGLAWPAPDSTLNSWSVEFDDLDADNRPEVLFTFGYGSGGSQPFFAVISGQDGSVRWATRLSTAAQTTGLQLDTDMHPAVADLNRDGVRDIVFAGVPVEFEKNQVSRSLRALDGQSGAPLWDDVPLEVWSGLDSYPGQYSRLFFRPVIEDLDGNGSPEIILADFSAELDGPSRLIRGLVKLRVLDGEDGREAGAWQSEDVELQVGHWHYLPSPTVLDLDGNGRRAIHLSLRGHNFPTRSVVLDPLARERPAAEGDPVPWHEITQPWPYDLDQDNSPDLVFLHNQQLSAWSAKSQLLKWSWPLPDDRAAILDILPAFAAQAAPEAEKASVPEKGSRGDRTRRAPTIVVAVDNSAIGIDGASGVPLWRGNSSRFLGQPVKWTGETDAHPSRLPRVLGKAFGTSSCVLTLPTHKTGELAAVQPAPVTFGPPVPYPWKVRRLPWVPPDSGRLADNIAAMVVTVAAHSLILVVLPGWLIVWTIRNRTWGLSSFMLLPVVVAIMLVFLRFAITNPLDLGGWDARTLSGQLQMVGTLALFGVPIVTFPALLARWLATARWRQALLLLAVTVPMTLVAGGFLLADDGWFRARPASQLQHYSWDGWYLVWFVGAYYTAIVYLVVLLGGAVVRAAGAGIPLPQRVLAWILILVGVVGFVAALTDDIGRIPLHNTDLRLIELVGLVLAAAGTGILTRDAKVHPAWCAAMCLIGSAAAVAGGWLAPHTADAYAYPLMCLGWWLFALGVWLHTKSWKACAVLLLVVLVLAIKFATS